jgi:hypothetical protein
MAAWLNFIKPDLNFSMSKKILLKIFLFFLAINSGLIFQIRAQNFDNSLMNDQSLYATARNGKEFKIFQFTRDQMPRIDGKTDDWEIVPEDYIYGSDLLRDTEDGNDVPEPADIDVKVRVGWVKDLNRLYFLYEAYDNFWDFERFNPGGYLNDIFEIVVDGDLSGGPFIYNPLITEARNWGNGEAHIYNHFTFSGFHAQNYHIFTPPVHNSWVLVWGSQPWIAEFPYANYAYDYNFKHGESGNLTLEFWITPFDHAPYEGPEQAKITILKENEYIGLSWSVLDFDGGQRDGHYNLSHNTKMVMDASYLCAFKLMPLEENFQKKLQADWSFKVVDINRRLVAFKDESLGEIIEWHWDFGDGNHSKEQFPIHQYKEPGVHYNVTLEVKDAAGASKKTRFWEVMIK